LVKTGLNKARSKHWFVC